LTPTGAKLGDFNVSKVAKNGMLHTQTGTPYYACPEVWKDLPYDMKSDIWSLGCVFYEMLALLPPFRSNNMSKLMKKVCSGNFNPPPSGFSQDIVQVVSSLLKVDPKERMTAS
jgi:NIMA (never in mitosis gene a)-related kinase